MGCQFVGEAMAGKEGNRHFVVFEDGDGRRGVAPGSEGIDSCDGLIPVEFLESGSADHSDSYGT